MAHYIPLFLLFLVAGVITIALFSLTSLLGPKNPTPEKQIPFECGSESTGAQHVRLSVKFYMTAILFVVFDVEVVLIYPWALQFQSMGWTGFAIMLPFLFLLVVALLYEWRKGAMEWET